MVDLSARQELISLVEELTHTGLQSLNEEKMKTLKSLCKRSVANVQVTYEQVMLQLAEEHSEIRLSAFQICNELFERSHAFRELLVSDFHEFIKLVTGTELDCSLPPPKPAAAQLKEKSLFAIKSWREKFGEGYPKLVLGYNHLKLNKKVDFEGLVAHSEAARRRRETKEARQRVFLQQRVQDVRKEMAERKPEIEDCLKQMESCFNLLFPRFIDDVAISSERAPKVPVSAVVTLQRMTSCSSSASLGTGEEGSLDDERDMLGCADGAGAAGRVGEEPQECCSSSLKGGEPSSGSGAGREPGSHVVRSIKGKEKAVVENTRTSDTSDSEVEWEDVPGEEEDAPSLQQHGFTSHSFSVPLELTPRVEIRETANNHSILETLRDCKQQLIDHFFPATARWMEWLIRAGSEKDQKGAIDIKNKMLASLEKYRRLRIVEEPTLHEVDRGPVEVPKATEKPLLLTTPSDWSYPSLTKRPAPELDPTALEAQLVTARQKRLPTKDQRGSGSQAHLDQDGRKEEGSPLSTASTNAGTEAPVVPFDLDLYHWSDHGNTSLDSHFIPVAQAGSLHRFWTTERDVTLSEDAKAQLKCRTITYAGKFKPVTHTCRAPLPNGTLCPRKDRYKCPFHGQIVDRDDKGVPIAAAPGPSSSAGPSSSGTTGASSETWEDIQQEVFAAKGLEAPKTGRKVKKPKLSELTDLDKHTESPRSRLESKVMNKRSQDRVAAILDEADAKRFRDKFGYNFNYALSK